MKRSTQNVSKNKKLRKTQSLEVKKEESMVEKGFDNSDREGEDFPRGGKDVITPLEKRSLQYQAQEDILFGTKTPVDDDDDDSVVKGKNNKKDKRAKKALGEEVKKKPKHLPYLSSKNLTEGTLILGAIREIHKHNLIVSLPNNMTGSVSIGNISDAITKMVEGNLTNRDELKMATDEMADDSMIESVPDMSTIFYNGQLVICCVLSVQKNQIELSLNPKHVNSNITGKTISPNMVISGSISSIEDHGYLIDFGVSSKNGFLLKKNASEYIKQYLNGAPLFVGQLVNCLIVNGASARSIPVTIDPEKITSSMLSVDTFIPLSSLLPGLLVNGIVKESLESGLLLSFLGEFEATVSLNHLPIGKYDTKYFPVGKKVKCRLLWVDVLNKKIGLSLQQRIISANLSTFPDIEIGDVFHTAKIVNVSPHGGIILSLDDESYGYCPLRLLYDEKEDKVQRVHSLGSIHSCRVVQFNLIDGVAVVSLRESVMEKPFMKLSDIKPGMLIDGTVERMTDKGVVIKLSDSFNGFCSNSELTDTSINVIRKKLTKGSSLKCRVLLADVDRRFILLTCRKSFVKSKQPPLVSFDGIQPGDLYDGMVAAVLPTGLVIKFYNKVKGFAPKRELCFTSSQAMADINLAYKIGQPVKCRVIESSSENKTLILSLNPTASDQLLPSVTGEKIKKVRSSKVKKDNGGVLSEVKSNKSKKVTPKIPSVKENVTEGDSSLPNTTSLAPKIPEKRKQTVNDNSTPSKKRKLMNNDVHSATDSSRKRNDTSSSNGVPATKKSKSRDNNDDVIPPLPVSGGFEWEETDRILSDKEQDIDEDNDDKTTNKKTRRQKKAAKTAEETFLYKKEFQLMESASKPPENADDFDRQLAVNPDSSSLWLQFMAYYLNLADVDKARAIANKALSTISFREEQEKLNVWYGLLNLENLYGTQETLMKTFQDALKNNEPLPLYYKLAGMYQLTDKMDLAEQVYQTMSKKFSTDTQVWIKYGLFLMQSKRIESARNLMKRSFNNLTKQQQVTIISKFAQYEFKFGDSERGRTMFESLLSSYPKRVDLWSVYIDMMSKTGNISAIRDIFERAVSLKLSVIKAKFVFKKYLAFEESHGSPATVNSVKEKAKSYVLSKTSEQEE